MKKILPFTVISVFVLFGCIQNNSYSTHETPTLLSNNINLGSTLPNPTIKVVSDTPTISPSPSKVTIYLPSTVTPTLTPKPTSINLINGDNLIYIQDQFNTGIYFFSYPYLNGSADYLPSNHVIAYPGENSPGSSDLSFANFDEKIAYVDTNNNIWIADLMNHDPKKIFSFPNDYKSNIHLIWSPDDKYLLIDTNDQKLPNMIYNVNSGEIEKWEYICDRLATSPRTHRLSIWCVSNNNSKQFAIIEWGGTLWFSDQLTGKEFLRSNPTQKNDPFNIFSLYYNVGWSSDGTYIAYFNPQDKNGTLSIANQTGEIQNQIPQKAYWLSDLYSRNSNLPSNPIQWSKNNKRLLVYAMGDPNFPCPIPSIEELNPFSKENSSSACWQVLNPETGSVDWTSANLEKYNEPDIKHTDGPMVISPNGEMIALFAYINGFDPNLFVINVRENKILLQAPFTVEKMRWGPKN